MNIDNILQEYLNIDINILKKIMIENHIYISGGFITSYLLEINNFKDIDFYMNNWGFYNFYNFFSKNIKNIDIEIIFQPYIFFKIQKYTFSFMKENKIDKIITIKFNNVEIDCIISENDTTPIDIIKKFDLTCCQNYYDGDKIYFLYKELFERKIGLLNINYRDIYFEDNKILLNRIKKYEDKGFTIITDFNNPIYKNLIIEDVKITIKDFYKNCLEKIIYKFLKNQLIIPEMEKIFELFNIYKINNSFKILIIFGPNFKYENISNYLDYIFSKYNKDKNKNEIINNVLYMSNSIVKLFEDENIKRLILPFKEKFISLDEFKLYFINLMKSILFQIQNKIDKTSCELFKLLAYF